MSSAVTSRTSLTLTSLFLGFVLFAPTAFMQAGGTECDQDGDGYVALTQSMLEVVVADNTFKANGNFAPEQWQNIFSAYKNKITADPALDASYRCNSLNFKKGAEPSRCDAVLLDPAGGVFDTSKVSSVAGNKVNPGAFDVPANGIDENCDGADGAVATATGVGAEKDLGSLVQRWVAMLSRAVAVISLIILIIGGIMYATAAGDEQKTSKARKAIIGAVVGLIVGLLAPAIVNTITASLA